MSHRAFNLLPGVSSYSLWPSPRVQVRRPDLQVFEIDESSVARTPSGDHHWYSMSERDFGRYRQRLAWAMHAWIAEVEASEGVEASGLVAHDALLSPIVLSDVERRRAMEGRSRTPILAFADTPSVRLFQQERYGVNTVEYPPRFLPMVEELQIFNGSGRDRFAVDLWATGSVGDHFSLTEAFPDLPAHAAVVSRGYEPSVFMVRPDRYSERIERLSSFVTAPSVDGRRPAEAVARPTGFDAVVVTGARSVDHHRLDAVVRAAAHYEAGDAVVATIVVGAEHDAEREALETLAWDHLGLKNVFFLTRQGQLRLAELFDCADVGVFPGMSEGGDELLIECLGCATPVIAVASDRDDELITDAIGTLVAGSDDAAQLAVSLGAAIAASINDGWKQTKGPVCAEWAAANFSSRRQAEYLLAMLDDIDRRRHDDVMASTDVGAASTSSVAVHARR